MQGHEHKERMQRVQTGFVRSKDSTGSAHAHFRESDVVGRGEGERVPRVQTGFVHKDQVPTNSVDFHPRFWEEETEGHEGERMQRV